MQENREIVRTGQSGKWVIEKLKKGDNPIGFWPFDSFPVFQLLPGRAVSSG
jgi:hypothetical protein